MRNLADNDDSIDLTAHPGPENVLNMTRRIRVTAVGADEAQALEQCGRSHCGRATRSHQRNVVGGTWQLGFRRNDSMKSATEVHPFEPLAWRMQSDSQVDLNRRQARYDDHVVVVFTSVKDSDFGQHTPPQSGYPSQIASRSKYFSS